MQIVYKTTVPTTQGTQVVFTFNTNWLVPQREIICVYCEQHMNTEIHCVEEMRSFSVAAGGTQNYH